MALRMRKYRLIPKTSSTNPKGIINSPIFDRMGTSGSSLNKVSPETMIINEVLSQANKVRSFANCVLSKANTSLRMSSLHLVSSGDWSKTSSFSNSNRITISFFSFWGNSFSKIEQVFANLIILTPIVAVTLIRIFDWHLSEGFCPKMRMPLLSTLVYVHPIWHWPC